MATSKYQDQLKLTRSHIWTLRGACLVMFLINLMLWNGWRSAPKDLTVHIPPDLESAASQAADKVPPENVYLFANVMFRQLQRWQKNGEKDAAQNIYSLQYFLTPRYREFLEKELERKGRAGELKDKVRGAQNPPGTVYQSDRVHVLSNDSWFVWLDFQITEHVGPALIKDLVVRYPMRVVRMDVDRVNNPWGLALDGYPPDAKPRTLSDEEVAATWGATNGKTS